MLELQLGCFALVITVFVVCVIFMACTYCLMSMFEKRIEIKLDAVVRRQAEQRKQRDEQRKQGDEQRKQTAYEQAEQRRQIADEQAEQRRQTDEQRKQTAYEQAEQRRQIAYEQAEQRKRTDQLYQIVMDMLKGQNPGTNP